MSEILDIANDIARDSFKAGAMDEITMRKIKALCLPSKWDFRPEDIRRSAWRIMSVKPCLPRSLVPAKQRCSSGNRDKKSQAA